MQAKRELRERPDTEVAVLDALVDREEGMTVFELRSHVDADIDDLETALASLKEDDLVSADTSQDPTVITATERARPEEGETTTEEQSFVDWIRDRVGL